MLRQKWGSVVCPGCRNLVGVNDERCYNCGRWNPGLWGFAPVLNRLGRDFGFTPLVLTSCMVLYTLSLVADPQGIRMGGLMNLLSPSIESLFLFGASGATPVFAAGRWWTVLTASWLHGGLLHIFFNMMWLRQLAPETAEAYGASRMIIIYTVSGIVGFTLSTFGQAFTRGGGFTVGASAPIFGLLAALVYYGKRSGSSLIGSQAKSYAIMMFIFGFIFPGVDNWAHFGGFAGGYGISKFLDPLRPERMDHLMTAFVCLGATGIAVVYSILTGLQYVR
jgi:rhomboid protease GluP